MTSTHTPAFAKTSRPVLPALALAALFFCPAFPARARQPAPSPPAAEGKIRLLSLDDVVQMALTNNLDILITSYTPILDQFALNGLFSPYDPALSLQVSRTFTTQPQGFYDGLTLPPYTTIVNNYAASLTGTLPFGMTYGLTTPMQ